MKETSTIYADITKVEKRPDEPNFRYIHARISDETKDLDGQTADYNWLKEALPDWFKWGNVRDMHENNVIGKGKELTDVPAEKGFDGVLKVVDPTAVIKVDEGLFTGVSIGIKGPRVINNKGINVHPSQPGRIVAGKIVEVSLVDHPCNENCKITVAKDAASGIEMITKGATLEKLAAVDILKDGALYWYKRANWNAAARRQATSSGQAMPGGRFPIADSSDVADAVHLYNTGHGQTPDVRAHIVARAKALGQGNPFKKKNQNKIAAVQVTPADLEMYKARFNPAFGNAGVALSDGSYVIMDEGDIGLAQALRLTGFGNVVAADMLIKRREEELTKASPATQQATPRQPDHATAPGARENRDNPEKNAPPPAKPKGSKNPDKETPAHQSVDASGSSAAFDDSSEADHPPTKPAKKDKTKKPKKLAGSVADQAGEPPAHTHSDDTGSVGTQTDTSKVSRKTEKIANGLTLLIKRKKNGNLKAVDPSTMSDKKLARAYKLLIKAGYAPPAGTRSTSPGVTNSGSDSFNPNAREVLDFQRGGAGSPGGGRALIEQLVRNMQGRVIDYSQGPQAPDVGRQGSGGVDEAEEAGETGPNELLNDGNLMRDGDPRINANTPQQALAQGGTLPDGGVSAGGDAGVPNTSLPFDTAPQAGAAPARMAPGSLPGTLGAPGDTDPRQNASGPSGSGGMSPASPPLRRAKPAAQAGPVLYPNPIVGDSKRGGVPNSSFINPQQRTGAPGTGSGTGSTVPGVATVRGSIGGTRSQVTNTARRKGAKADKKKGKSKKKLDRMIDKLAKSAVADRVEAVAPDSVKAAVAGLLKKFVKNLERDVLVKYATADQLKAIQDDIDKLGAMAQPGGPFVGQVTAVDKVVNANEFAQPETQVIGPDILDQIERFERMTKSDNRQLAASASVGLKKLLETHFPKEFTSELQKRKRSATK